LEVIEQNGISVWPATTIHRPVNSNISLHVIVFFSRLSVIAPCASNFITNIHWFIVVTAPACKTPDPPARRSAGGAQDQTCLRRRQLKVCMTSYCHALCRLQ